MHFVSLFKKYQLAILLTHKNIVSFINIPRNSDIEADWRNPVSPIVLLSGNPFGLPAQRSRRLTESSPTGLSSNTRLAQLRQHVRQAPATLSVILKETQNEDKSH